MTKNKNSFSLFLLGLIDDEKKVLTRIGNYTPTGKTLGKGHFARVVEAYHTLLKVKVAIKIINKIEISDIYVKKNLKRETKIMSKISHPNIIYIFETIETTQHYYIITELGSGGDLCNFVKSQRYGKLDERRARLLAKQLISAVGHLHERGIVHRDLKMENILLDNSKEKIKIVDFGLSNFCQLNELLKTHCGSPEYAAPELYIKGRKYGPEVDIWSLGIIFYGMLVGRLPFQTLYKSDINPNDKKKHLMYETKNGLTIKHYKHLMGLSYLIRNLITKMLKPDANERISMHELQVHAWVYGTGNIREFPVEDRNWRKKIIAKISDYYGMKCCETYNRILNLPYGPLGGIYNIEKYAHLNEKLNEYYLKCDSIKSKNSSPLISYQGATRTNIYSKLTNKPSKINLITNERKERNFIPKLITDYKNYSNDFDNLQQNIIDNKKLSNNLNDKIKMEYSNSIKTDNYKFNTITTLKSPTKPKQIKNNINNQQQLKQQSTMTSNSTPKKPNKSTSIKMINYLNAKISQALGIYSIRKNRKFAAGIETKGPTTLKGSAGHLQFALNNALKKISDKEKVEEYKQYHNNCNDKITKYQDNNNNQKYFITSNLIKHKNNIQIDDYNQKSRINLPCNNILNTNKTNHQKYLIKPKLFGSNSNQSIKAKLFGNNNGKNININYNKNSTMAPFSSILQKKYKLNQLSNRFNINSECGSRRDGIKKR